MREAARIAVAVIVWDDGCGRVWKRRSRSRVEIGSSQRELVVAQQVDRQRPVVQQDGHVGRRRVVLACAYGTHAHIVVASAWCIWRAAVAAAVVVAAHRVLLEEAHQLDELVVHVLLGALLEVAQLVAAGELGLATLAAVRARRVAVGVARVEAAAARATRAARATTTSAALAVAGLAAAAAACFFSRERVSAVLLVLVDGRDAHIADGDAHAARVDGRVGARVEALDARRRVAQLQAHHVHVRLDEEELLVARQAGLLVAAAVERLRRHVDTA